MPTYVDPSRYFAAPLTLDAKDGVWYPKNATRGIGYPSDDVARQLLLPLLRSASDLGSMSSELESKGRDWPARYYLSPERANLLRPFPWDRSARVLEVGCGCGTITRFLGETFHEVIAVEGEAHRAIVAAERTRDQSNVEIICAPLASVTADGIFDLIFCIGVLEYAPLFSDSSDPMQEMLRGLRRALTPTGILVLAIENQLGLKYFAGAAEDHTGIRYDGIEGYQRSGAVGPRTLGRSELERKLLDAGFSNQDFYYPFPDYKFPIAIVNEMAARSRDEQVGGFVSTRVAADYRPVPTKPRFDQTAVLTQLTRNELLAEMSNSFLVFATNSTSGRFSPEWDAIGYRMAPRQAPFWCELTVKGLDTINPTVQRRRLISSSASGPVSMADKFVEPWLRGQTVLQLATHAGVRKGATTGDVARALQPWYELLRAQVGPDGTVPGEMIDLVAQNVVVTAEGPKAIDQEWVWETPIPFHVVVSRCLALFYDRLRVTQGARSQLRHRTDAALIRETARALGLDYGVRHLYEFAHWQSRFYAAVNTDATSSRRVFVRCFTPPRLQHGRAAIRNSRTRASLLISAIVARIRS